jgi:hypothetical protein
MLKFVWSLIGQLRASSPVDVASMTYMHLAIMLRLLCQSSDRDEQFALAHRECRVRLPD